MDLVFIHCPISISNAMPSKRCEIRFCHWNWKLKYWLRKGSICFILRWRWECVSVGKCIYWTVLFVLSFYYSFLFFFIVLYSFAYPWWWWYARWRIKNRNALLEILSTVDKRKKEKKKKRRNMWKFKMATAKLESEEWKLEIEKWKYEINHEDEE